MLLLAQQWTAWGHPCQVFTRPVTGQTAREDLAGITIRRCIRTVSLGPLFGASFLTNLALSLWRHRHKFDVVLAGQAPWEAAATGWFHWMLRKPTVVRIANTGPFGDLAQLPKIKGGKLLQKLLLANRAFVALSQQAKEELFAAGCDPAAIHMSTNGVDTSFFRPENNNPERARTVLFVGRVAPQKDPQTLLRAWKHVNQSGQFQLLIAGSGPLKEELLRTCEDEQIRGVNFLGQCDDVLTLYHRAGVFVLPSLSEGCSNALLEAMACGLCPVVSDIGGNRDVVKHQENGLLVPPGDPSELANALQQALHDPQLQDSLATQARQHIVTTHSIETVARDYLNLFEQLLKRGR